MPKIDVTVKVKNDNSHYSRFFECDSLFLDLSDKTLLSMIEQTTQDFSQPVDDITVKATMKGI